MKAIVFHDVGDIRLDDIAEPKVETPADAIVKITASAPNANPRDDNWVPGSAPSQALRWGVEALAKAGTLSLIGVYSPLLQSFPIGKAMMKNITMRMGNCNHRRYVPDLINKVKSDVIDPQSVLTQVEPLTSAIEAYKRFDKREAGWMKVELVSQ